MDPSWVMDYNVTIIHWPEKFGHELRGFQYVGYFIVHPKNRTWVEHHKHSRHLIPKAQYLMIPLHNFTMETPMFFPHEIKTLQQWPYRTPYEAEDCGILSCTPPQPSLQTQRPVSVLERKGLCRICVCIYVYMRHMVNYVFDCLFTYVWYCLIIYAYVLWLYIYIHIYTVIWRLWDTNSSLLPSLWIVTDCA